MGTGIGPHFKANLFPHSFELGTFRVWGERDNHYTTETAAPGLWVLQASCIVYKSTLNWEGKYANIERGENPLVARAFGDSYKPNIHVVGYLSDTVQPIPWSHTAIYSTGRRVVFYQAVSSRWAQEPDLDIKRNCFRPVSNWGPFAC